VSGTHERDDFRYERRSATRIAANIVDVDRGAGETGASSGQVLDAAHSLAHESNHLKVEVDGFLATVRAA
jgi:methyl-accepting chemotaxis protein